MKFQKKPRLTPQEVSILGLIGLVALSVLGVLIGANIALSRIVPGGGEFFVAWEAARAFLFEHTEPYSGTVATLTQELVYGRFAGPGENPYFLSLPFFLLPVYYPFALFSDPATARGLWMSLGEAGLLGAAFLSLRLIESQPRRFFLALYSLLSIFGLYSVASIFEGALSVSLVFLFIGVLFASYMERDELAGALLAFCLFHWEVSFLFLLLIFWRVFSEKRWRVLAGFGMTLTILLIFAFLTYPGWVYPFLVSSLALIRAPFGITPAVVFMRLWPEWGARIAQAVTVLVVIILGYEWASLREADFRRFVWAVCLTLSVTPLIGFRTEIGNLIVMFPGLALIFAAATDRWGYWLAALLWLFAFLIPWGLFAHALLFQDQLSRDLLFLFLPLFTAAGLYWTRWWFVRPPRTWLDQVRSQN